MKSEPEIIETTETLVGISWKPGGPPSSNHSQISPVRMTEACGLCKTR
jgi:hypothetical protein